MRLHRIAIAAFLAASSPSGATPALAFATSPIRVHHRLSSPSSLILLSTLLAHRSSTSIAAAEGKDVTEGECNVTDDNEIDTPPLSQMYDEEYPGTAVQRLKAVHERVAVLANDGTLDGKWEDARRRLLWAGGLRDLPNAAPGQGYTGHSFNDFNHVDLTAMNDGSSDNLNDGTVKGIAVGNRLGPGIRVASLPELGPGGSWSTCAMGCNSDPPNDVAHVQFRSRVAFKLVWVPNDNFDEFVLVDDEGKLLAKGKPSDGPGALPNRREREMNYGIMKGSKYATVAESLASSNSTAAAE
ncbi:hypothetical protein ACHAXT_006261 [Thalassiosira profunda]